MAATNYTPISLYYSTTAAAVPVNTNLVNGELAINITDGKLFYKDNGGTVQVLATKGAGTIGGSNTQVQYNNSGALAGSANLTFNGTTLTANTLNLTNALGTTYGGTGLTSFTANGVVYASSSSVLATGSALTFDGTLFSNTQTALAGGVLANLSNTTNGSFLQFSAPGVANVRIGNPNADALAFYTFGAGAYPEQMRLTSTGLGIGTSSPTSKLTVSGAISASGTIFRPDSGFIQWNSTGASGGTNRAIVWADASSNLFFGTGAGNSTQATIDSSGNLGIGVTPSAWNAGSPVIQMAGGTSIYADSNQTIYGLNAAFISSFKYVVSDFASQYIQVNGQHQWQTAPSGTAGNAITFTQAMTLGADGNLAIGSTSTNNARLFSFVTDASLPAILARQDGAGPIQTWQTSGAEKMRLDASGNLGIGTTSPSTYAGAAGQLVVFGGVNTTFANCPNNVILVNNGTIAAGLGAGINFTVNYDNSIVTTYAIISGIRENAVSGNAAGALTFGTRDAAGSVAMERARIDSSGNLLVGTTAGGATDSNSFSYAPASVKALDLNHLTATASGTNYARFNYAGSTIGSITQNGTTGVLYNLTSDQRLKENIQDAKPAADLIDAIQVRQFDWKSDGSHQRYGFVAQELVVVAPEAVHQPADPDEMMAVDYSKLVPMLVKEIQSLRIRIAQLEAK